ncbi:MAG: superoxide dismutase family protein [Novosphingobium sp.]
MKTYGKLAAFGLILAVGSPIAARSPAPFTQSVASAPVFTDSGRDAGYAVVMVKRDKAILRLSFTGITPGEHGLHFHTTGSCKGTKFSGAGGHLNPLGHQHGMNNPAGSHLGDLPNVTADANGVAIADITLKGSARDLVSAMMDKDGTAIVLHARPDDYVTDPAGNSGDRIACGVFKRN